MARVFGILPHSLAESLLVLLRGEGRLAKSWSLLVTHRRGGCNYGGGRYFEAGKSALVLGRRCDCGLGVGVHSVPTPYRPPSVDPGQREPNKSLQTRQMGR